MKIFLTKFHKKRFISRLTLFALSGIFVLFCCLIFTPSRLFIKYSGSQAAISKESADRLRCCADKYLRETASILGPRYNHQFYSSLVQNELNRVFSPPEDESICRETLREEIALLSLFETAGSEETDSFNEAILFLKEFETEKRSEPVSFSFFYKSGNPLNAAADRLLNITDPPLFQIFYQKTTPLYGLFGELFLLLSLTASFFSPESNFFALSPNLIREFTSVIQNLLFLSLVFLPKVSHQAFLYVLYILSPQLAVRKTVFLRR